MQKLTYGEILASAIQTADRLLAGQGGITQKYRIRSVGVDMVCAVLSEGWDAFDELATKMGTGYIPYTTSIGTVLGAAISPAILMGSSLGRVGKSLSFWGGDEKAVCSMYDNKSLILAVHHIGLSKLSDYKKYNKDENRLQRMKEEIVAELISNND